MATSGGRVIADTQLPFEAFKAYVRDPSGAMPPFHAEILSDSDLADIYRLSGIAAEAGAGQGHSAAQQSVLQVALSLLGSPWSFRRGGGAGGMNSLAARL